MKAHFFLNKMPKNDQMEILPKSQTSSVFRYYDYQLFSEKLDS